jgi:DNA invertase Pin-like site-specific DNA recombinase
MKTARIATYHRCSTLDQNPKLAREELRAVAARLGELVLEIEEKGSGARNDRPGFRKLMEAARKGAIDVVAVWKLDRFGRSTVDLLDNIKALGTAGVRFTATSQGLDVKPDGDAMSRLLVTMLAAVAEFERDLIRERTRLGLAAARRSGKRLGRPSSLPAGGADQVAQLRAAGKSWAEVAEAVGVSVMAARRAAAN